MSVTGIAMTKVEVATRERLTDFEQITKTGEVNDEFLRLPCKLSSSEETNQHLGPETEETVNNLGIST